MILRITDGFKLFEIVKIQIGKGIKFCPENVVAAEDNPVIRLSLYS